MNDLTQTRRDNNEAGLDAALMALRSDPALWQLSFELAAERILDFALSHGGAERAELWRLDPEQAALQCLKMRPQGAIAAALSNRNDYFAALARGVGFTESAGGPNDLKWHQPIFVEGVLWGVLLLKRPTSTPWTAAAHFIASTLGDLLAQALIFARATHAEQRFQVLAQNAPVGIWQLDQDENVVYRNQYIIDLLGADYKKWNRAVWSELIQPDNDHDMDDDVAAVKNQGELRSSYRIKRPDGTERHVLWHVVAEQRAPYLGESMGRVGIAVDITELWEAQERLRELTIRQRAILDNAAHGIIATNKEGYITLFNPAAERMLGYSAAEVMGKEPRMFCSQADNERIWEILRNLNLPISLKGFIEYSERMGTHEDEWTYVRKDGSHFPVMMSATVLRNARGEAFGFMGLITDLSERKRMVNIELREQALISHINRGTSATIGAQFFNQLVDELKRATGADYGNIFELIPDHPELRGRLLTDPEIDALRKTFDFAGAPLEPVVRDGHYLRLTDLRARYGDHPDVRAMNINELIAVPLFSSTGKVLGTLMVAHKDSLPEPDLAQHLLEIFAVRASSELERLHTERALETREAAQRWLYAASECIHAQRDVAGVAREAVVAASRHASKPLFVTMSLSKSDGYHVLDYEGPPENAPQRDKVYASRPDLMRKVLQTPHSILLLPDYLKEQSDPNFIAEAETRNMRAAVLIALADRGQDVGVITLSYDDPNALAQLDLDNLAMFGRAVTLALGRALHRQELEYQADHDGLTGLFNRTVLHRDFQRWHDGGGATTALLLLDLDRFKEVNDTLGHHVGDALLRQIGERLRTGINYSDATLTRLGGDEFAILLSDPALTAAQAGLHAENILKELRRPFQVNNVNLEIGASIGVALYPDHGEDSHALLRSADVAMYEAKRGGGIAFYNRNLDFNSPERLALIADLSTGIRERELILFYQPKVDLYTRQVVGFEGLLRWQHKRLGLLAPDRFLPLAEMSDAIHDLARMVLEEACEQMQKWLQRGWTGTLAINLSARNLIDDRIVRHIAELTHHYEIPAGRLELEITETALIHDPEHALHLLERIAALGVQLSIDDFGTGYSSLAYLRQMPISTLKIDRTFIRDMLTNNQDQLIVRSTIQLAHGLGLQVIAEGVENAEVLARLCEMGCDQAQGYYFTRPLPVVELEHWLLQKYEWRQPVTAPKAHERDMH
ncbi:MAG: hypothetical protein JWM78_3783 [Verrucomicrobiaceae bacterium]|nr:hypothetical protein [Verrucomicrobiaceae bacterium]